jgi:hypothetical protein
MQLEIPEIIENDQSTSPSYGENHDVTVRKLNTPLAFSGVRKWSTDDISRKSSVA